MKAALMTAATVVALVAATGSQAMAQASSTATKATASAAGDDLSDNNVSGAERPTSASGTVLKSTSEVTPESTSTASLPAAVKAASPRKVSGEFYSETFIPSSDFEHGRGEAVLNSYGGVKFDLGNTNALSLRQYFDYMSAAHNDAGKFKIQDTVINFTRGELAKFKDGSSLTLIARAYLPTGETSRSIDQNGKERLYLLFNKSIAKVDLTYVVLGQLWQQSHNYNVVTKKDGTIDNVQNNQASLTNEIDAFYNINTKLALGMIVGMDNIAKTRTPGKSTSADDVYFQPTLQVSPVKGLTLQAYLYDELNIRNPTQNHALFRGSETTVSFNVAAAL